MRLVMDLWDGDTVEISIPETDPASLIEQLELESRTHVGGTDAEDKDFSWVVPVESVKSYCLVKEEDGGEQ